MSLDVTTLSNSGAYSTRSLGQMGQRTSASSAVGVGSRISVATIQNLAGAVRPYFQLQSSTMPFSTADGKETMRGLNDRLAEYLAKVRSLEESNSKLEDQIKGALTEKGAAAPRDWSAYENTLAGLREQLTDLSMDNARLMLHIDNARLAADDFKVKFETESGVRQAVEADIANLRKMINNTNMCRVQLEGQVETLKEELDSLHKNHEEDTSGLIGQIRASSVDVQMDTPKSNDLGETIAMIRRQYENAMQKNQEDSEAWFNAKSETISAEVMNNTETLQEDRGQINDLHRQYQVLEIDLQALHSMNHSLEDTLRATEGRYAQAVTLHNATIQQLEAELGEVRAQVERQRVEYQTLLSIKVKLQEEISTYQQLLEGTGVADGGGKDKGAGAREDTKDKGAGAREDTKDKGAGARDDTKDKGAGAYNDIKTKGAGADDSAKDKVHDTRDNAKGASACEDINSTNLPEYDDDSVEFTLEQALNAVPPERDLRVQEKTAEVEVVPQCDLKLSAPAPVVTEKPEEEQKEETEDKDTPPKGSTEADMGREVQEEQEGVQQREEEPAKLDAETSEIEEPKEPEIEE